MRKCNKGNGVGPTENYNERKEMDEMKGSSAKENGMKKQGIIIKRK